MKPHSFDELFSGFLVAFQAHQHEHLPETSFWDARIHLDHFRILAKGGREPSATS
jgi:hypothetical protein